jgi:hypothetical protein
LSDTERELFEEHFFDCPTCGADIKAAELVLSELEGRRAEEVAPVRVPWTQVLLDRLRPIQWVPAMAGLAMAGWFGGQNWQMRTAPAFVAQAGVVVKPAAKSAGGPVVAIPRGAARFTVVLDLPEALPEVHLEFRDRQGALKDSVRAANPGDRVSVVLSSANYSDGPYEVVVPGSGLRYNLQIQRN